MQAVALHKRVKEISKEYAQTEQACQDLEEHSKHFVMSARPSHEYQALAERCKKQEEEHALAIQHTAQNAIRDWRAHGRAHKRLAGGLGLLPVY
nr:hypothetical protein Iba_chr06bCG13130 [Ipomoea batatas]